jgi:hypothetical protein
MAAITARILPHRGAAEPVSRNAGSRLVSHL